MRDTRPVGCIQTLNANWPPGQVFLDHERLEEGDTWPEVANLMHETAHREFRAGQQLRADDGRWLPVKRDVPTASALTYLLMLKEEGGSLPDPGLKRLLQIGIRYAQDDPQ